ncbi:MAG: hypothetical protein WDW36_002913 [Sanguina aurantia]
MHHTNSFLKKTKKGQVLKVTREHYLRDDIWSGSPVDAECDPASHKLGAAAKQYLLIDTNVALHQIDFLEHAAVVDVIVCGVVLEEVQHKNRAAYERLRALVASPSKRFYVFSNEHHKDTHVKGNPGESPNDRNDRAIRRATAWYSERLKGKVEVLLLTNDVENREKAKAEGLKAQSVREYARGRAGDVPELAEVVAAAVGGGEEDAESGAKERDAGGSSRGTKRAKIFQEHKSHDQMQAGLKDGRYHQGTLRVNRFNYKEGWVASESVGEDILISGSVDMNRAFDGDSIVVELLPESQWKSESARLPGRAVADIMAEGEAAEGRDEEDEEAGDSEFCQVAPADNFGGDGAAGAATGKGKGKSPTARIVGILKRSWRSRGYCGSLDEKSAKGKHGAGASAVLFMPVDRCVPKIRRVRVTPVDSVSHASRQSVRRAPQDQASVVRAGGQVLMSRQIDELMDKRIVVNIDGWEADSWFPSGHYVRSLGKIGDKDTETEVILIENDIITSPFTDAVHACVPPLPWVVTDTHRLDPNRVDMRHLCVCSVDPPGCKDIDDALHVRTLPNGNFEIGVHIADVTHFLKPDTAMDSEAATRATTCYLVQRRIDMLPKPLTEDICSLRGGQERLAFSVLWEVTPDVHVLSTTFTKSLICSRAAMTYGQAQDTIDDTENHGEIAMSLRSMLRLAKVLRQRRADAGALQLASPEVKFTIDEETQNPLEVGMYQTMDTNSMVEEMMLLANVTVAEKIVRHFPACSLLRHHQTPPPRQFEPLLNAASAAGFELDVQNSKALSDSLNNAVRPDDSYFNKLVRIMCTRCMTQALYFGSGEADPADYHHYGLAAPIYTHFTSPIRRYADVVVHRLLAAAIGLDPLPDRARDRASLRVCSDNINKRHRNAQLAGRASVELHTLIFFLNRTLMADARVTRVKANGLIVFVPKYGIEGPVFLNPKDNNEIGQEGAVLFKLDQEKQTVVSSDGLQRYTIFDKCAVEIKVTETLGHRRQLQLTLVPRGSVPVSELMS